MSHRVDGASPKLLEMLEQLQRRRPAANAPRPAVHHGEGHERPAAAQLGARRSRCGSEATPRSAPRPPVDAPRGDRAMSRAERWACSTRSRSVCQPLERHPRGDRAPADRCRGSAVLTGPSMKSRDAEHGAAEGPTRAVDVRGRGWTTSSAPSPRSVCLQHRGGQRVVPRRSTARRPVGHGRIIAATSMISSIGLLGDSKNDHPRRRRQRLGPTGRGRRRPRSRLCTPHLGRICLEDR